MKDITMKFVMVRIEPELLEEIMESNGQILDQLMSHQIKKSSFSDDDISQTLDFHELSALAQNPNHPFALLFAQGTVLLEHYEWNFGPPVLLLDDEIASMSYLFLQYLKELSPESLASISSKGSPEWSTHWMQNYLYQTSLHSKLLIFGVQ